MKISVLQWNVWYQEKADNILKFLRQTDADILCLQELTTDSDTNPKRDIPLEVERLGYSSAYCETVVKPHYRQGHGVFTKLPIINRREVVVQQGTMDTDDFTEEKRVYIEALLAINDTALKVGTIHASYTPGFAFAAAKEQESNRIVESIRDSRQRFIFTGDLNALPGSSLVQKLDQLLLSAGPEYTEATWTTKAFDFGDFKADSLSWRPDYVYVTPDIKVISSRILKTDYSDHLPILVEIEVIA